MITRLLRPYLLELLQDPGVLEQLLRDLRPRFKRLIRSQARRGFDEHHLTTLVPEVGKGPYTVAEIDRPATTWAFFDFSNSRGGDQFRIQLLVGSGGTFRPFESYVVEDQPAEPLAAISGRFAPSLRITIAQTRGLSKEVPLEIFSRYEGR